MVTFSYDNAGNGRAIVVCHVDDIERHRDNLDPNSQHSRSRFIKALTGKVNGELKGIDVDAELISIAQKLATEQAAPKAPVSDRAQLQAERDEESAELLAAMPPATVDAAEAMLRNPELISEIAADLATLGIVGEKTLARTLYLVGVSRLLGKPVSACVQAPSSSGKTFVIDTVAKCFPPEAVLKAQDITQNALFYLPPGSLLHRFVVGGERPRTKAGHEDERAEATRALRQMLSDGDLRKLVPQKDNDGKHRTDLIEQYGPISYCESTTETTIFDEDQNRMIMLAADETPEQSKRIIDEKCERVKPSGGVDPEALDALVQKHHAAQRMLRRVRVVIPWADRLGNAMPHAQPQSRRAIGQLLGIIQSSAILHQFQREQTADGVIVATLADYAIAREVVSAPLARSLDGDLPPAVSRLADRLRERFGFGDDGATFTSGDVAGSDPVIRSPVKIAAYLRAMLATGDAVIVEAGGRGRANVWRMTPGGVATVGWLPTVEALTYDPTQDS